MTEAPTDLPLEHVLRPRPPWRRGGELTECGKPAGDTGRPVLTRDEFLAKVRKQGKQRSALTTCITCWQTAARNPSWDEDPIASLIREASRFRWSHASADARTVSFREELLAIAELIRRHEDEFDGILTGIGDTVSLADARRNTRRRRHA